MDKRVEDRGHQEVCDATSSIAEACCERVACPNYVLVEEACGPYLTGHKATAKNTNEKSESQEAFGVGNCTCEYSGYGASQQTACESVSRTVKIAQWSRDKPNKETGWCQS